MLMLSVAAPVRPCLERYGSWRGLYVGTEAGPGVVNAECARCCALHSHSAADARADWAVCRS